MILMFTNSPFKNGWTCTRYGKEYGANVKDDGWGWWIQGTVDGDIENVRQLIRHQIINYHIKTYPTERLPIRKKLR